MHYIVRAKFNTSKASEFLTKLTDGTIAAQKPDGEEIVASMKRARMDDEGYVHWSEVCYCPTPLKHERETVYDHYFSEFSTEETDQNQEHSGHPFMDYLKTNSN